jgi:translation elongation factor EF-Tu-like GTPase
MATDHHYIEAEIHYLRADEGGRQSGIYSGYRGQFYYNGDDYDGFQFFPDCDGQVVEPGTTVRAFVQFRANRWNEVHSKLITVGMKFQIREGNGTVGHGVVTKIALDPTEAPPG